jgi:DNA-binding GntR family transcriptional regulator
MSRISGVAELIRLMILRGEIAAGARVVEPQLAQRLRIGRGGLREVLRQLEGYGLLVANESGGMRVVSLDAGELAATLHVRATLEALGAGLAAERVGDGTLAPAAVGELAELAEAADAAARSRPREAAVVADRNFHRAVGALAANEPCHDALDRIWDRIIVGTREPDDRRPPNGHLDGVHHELLVAIAAADAPGASELARRHVLATLA